MSEISNLPKSAQTLIALIGLPATMRLVDQYGGCLVGLYQGPTSLDRMAETVGRENAAALLKFYGYAQFTVPMCMLALKEVRNAKIVEEFDRLTREEKISARAAVISITRLFTPHIHERTIWRILNTLPKTKEVDPRQAGLF